MTTSQPAPSPFPRARFLAMAMLAAFGIAGVVATPYMLPLGLGNENPMFLFLGRFHPLVVHLPIGMFLLAALFEFLAFFPPFRHLRSAILTILLFAALGGALAVLHGCLLAAGGGDTSEALEDHLQAGVAMAVCMFLLLPLRVLACSSLRRAWAVPYHLMLWPGILLLSVASHLGGNLTHGPDYLVKYMPPGMKQSLTGLPAPVRGFIGLQDAPPDMQATLYDALIAPAFENHCVSCHNEGKTKGGLRMDSLAELMKGGDSGPAITPGDLAKSEVHRRVTLPMDDDEFMPPDGKKPMTADQVAVLEWWITSGKPGETPLDALGEVPAAVEKAVDEFMASKATTGQANEGTGTAALPLDDVLAGINAGFSGRLMPLSRQPGDGLMLVTAGVGVSFDDSALSKITPVAGQLREADLSRTGVTDQGLAVLSGATGLRKLRLDNTGISMAGLEHLRPMRELEILNLYATPVDDTAVETLAAITSLRKLYVAGTKLTPAGLQKLAAALPGCEITGEGEKPAADPVKPPTP